MQTELIKQFLEAGVHFGHQTKRWNPKMAKYIFGRRSGIYIINLEKSVDCLDKARAFLTEIASQGKAVLFVGTKRQAQEIVQTNAQRCGMFWMSQRWLGGTLTNFPTIKKSIARLKDIERMSQDGTFNSLTKKEIALFVKEKDKLNKNLVGIVNMENLPAVLCIVDSQKEANAIHEARILNIPVVGLIDTNCNPNDVDYPIPGNDDAIKSVRLVVSLLADSVLEGRKRFLSYLTDQEITKKKEAEEKLAVPQQLPAEDEEIKDKIEEVLTSRLGLTEEDETKPKLHIHKLEDEKMASKRRVGK